MFNFQAMAESGVYNLVFSSSCTVYGDPQYLPVDEKHPTGNCTNPYGRSKFMVEQILTDAAKSNPVSLTVTFHYTTCVNFVKH